MYVAISVFHFIVGVGPFDPFLCPRIKAAHNGCFRLHDNFFTNSLASCFALLIFLCFPYKRYFLLIPFYFFAAAEAAAAACGSCMMRRSSSASASSVEQRSAGARRMHRRISARTPAWCERERESERREREERDRAGKRWGMWAGEWRSKKNVVVGVRV